MTVLEDMYVEEACRQMNSTESTCHCWLLRFDSFFPYLITDERKKHNCVFDEGTKEN